MKLPRFLLVLALAALPLSGCVLSSEFNRLQDQLTETQARLTMAQEQLSAEEQASQLLQNELAETKNRLQVLQANLTQAQQARNQEIAAMEARLREVQQAGGSRAAELKLALDSARQERDSQVEALQRELAIAVREAQEKAAELDRQKQTQRDLLNELKAEIEDGKITITNLRGQLSVNLIDKILFDSGSAELNEEGKQVLQKVSGVLKRIDDQRISVEGHTDDVPIAARARDRFPTNWELSTSRASTVVRFLVEQGVSEEKISATGYSMYRPVALNDTPENRRLNRRIEIVLLPVFDTGRGDPAMD
jgi:chemotaxis protein MotB